jgi:dephospho-CoA kinase
MITIGLTGGIASGKSLVAELFGSFGAQVIDSDSIAREVVEPGTIGWQSVVAEFGQDILSPDGTVDRAKLGSIIFSDRERRTTLNNILHPLIIHIIQERIVAIGRKHPEAIVIADIPLLIECGMQHEFDAVVVVWTSAELQRKRIMERDGLSAAEAQQRIDAQMPLDEKQAHGTFVVKNDGNTQQTEEQVKQIFLTITQQAGYTQQKRHK